MGKHLELQIKKKTKKNPKLEGTIEKKKTPKEIQSRSYNCKVKQNMLGENRMLKA